MIIVYSEATTVGGVTNAISACLRGMPEDKHIKLICRRKSEVLKWCYEQMSNSTSCQPTALRNYFDILGWFDVRNLFSIMLAAKNAKVVHFHLHTPFSCLPAIFIVGLFTKTRIITTEHYVTQIRFLRRRSLPMLLSLIRELKIRFLLLVKKLSFRFIWRVIAVSESNKQFIISYFGDSVREKTETISNGISALAYPAMQDSANLKKNARFYIVTIASLNNQKGHEYLLKAVPTVIQAVPEARFLLVGDGHLRGLLEKTAKELKIDHVVEFMGWRTDVAEILSLSDIFVLPSLFEGLPLSVLEAMASGKAIVATNVDGTADAVVDGVTGFLVPPGNPSELAQKIIYLLRNPELRERFGREGRSRVLRLFTAERMSSAYLDLYNRALKEIQ